MDPNQPLFKITGKRTAEMLRRDLYRARTKWIGDGPDDERGPNLRATGTDDGETR